MFAKCKLVRVHFEPCVCGKKDGGSSSDKGCITVQGACAVVVPIGFFFFFFLNHIKVSFSRGGGTGRGPPKQGKFCPSPNQPPSPF